MIARWPIIYFDTLIIYTSIHKSRNNVWNNKAYLIIAKTNFVIIASNEIHFQSEIGLCE